MEQSLNHLKIDQKHRKRIHLRILSILNIHSEHDTKYYLYESFEKLFRRAVTVDILEKIELPDLDDEFNFI